MYIYIIFIFIHIYPYTYRDYKQKIKNAELKKYMKQTVNSFFNESCHLLVYKYWKSICLPQQKSGIKIQNICF